MKNLIVISSILLAYDHPHNDPNLNNFDPNLILNPTINDPNHNHTHNSTNFNNKSGLDRGDIGFSDDSGSGFDHGIGLVRINFGDSSLDVIDPIEHQFCHCN
jgi:hypothetical protein